MTNAAIFRRNRSAFCGAVVLVAVVVAAVAGPPLLYLHNHCTYETQNLAGRLLPPSWQHPLGTDVLGRDLLIRVLYGGRISLLVGLVGTLITVLIGVAYGAVAGFLGGFTDAVLMRTLDALYSLPILILIVILLSLFERGLVPVIIGLGCISWLTMARIVRGQVLSLRNEQFIDAARSMGVTQTGILWRHIVPNAVGPIIAAATLTVPDVVLSEGFLSFLGLGVQAPMPSLGTLINDGAQAMAVYPGLPAGPAILLAVAMVSLNLVGDGLRDVLDPRSRKVVL